MGEFKYDGVDKGGAKISGSLDAGSEGELRMALRGMGIRPVRISKGNMLNADLGALLSGGTSSLSGIQLLTFTRQLQVLMGSGIPVVQGLEILSEQSTDRNVKTIVTAMREKISGGSYLWEALSMYPKAFPKIYVSMIRAGESSGSVDQILKRLNRYLEDSERLKKILKSASMYPIIVVSIGIGVVSLMMIFVIPKFEELLKTSGQSLPGPTQFVIDVSHFMVNNLLYLVGGVTAAIYLGMRYAKSPEGRAFIDRAMFKAPLFGGLMQKGGVARFARTLQTLLGAGVNLIDAIDICKETIDNAVLEDAVGKIRAEVESGKTLGSVVTRMSVFPRMAVQMIAVGESTGNLDKMLEKVADFYEEEVETTVNGLTKLIEPLVLVFLGGTVGGLMIAMYLPIFKLAGGAD